MSAQNFLHRIFRIIMRPFIETRQSSHCAKIADRMDLPVEKDRNLLRMLFSPGFHRWQFSCTEKKPGIRIPTTADSRYSSEYRAVHSRCTRKAGRLIDLIDSGAGHNIRNITTNWLL